MATFSRNHAAAQRVLASDLSHYGFDICHSFRPQWYNDSVVADGVSILPPLPTHAAPQPSQTPTTTTAFLVGNTKRMWPLFLNWIEKRRKLEDEDSIVKNDPLDTYAKESIEKVVEETAARHFVVGDHNETTPGASSSYDIFWSFDTRRDRLISMQRIAAVSGLCHLDEASNMAIHPLFGPWLSFRAVILFHSGDMTNDGDGDLSALPAPDPIPSLLTPEEEANARAFIQKAFDKNTPKDDDASIRRGWVVKCLIASRDSAALGREEHRFSDSQLMYHYTKDAKYLQK